MEGWAGIPITFGTSTGDLKQIYPTWAPVGVNPATATSGDSIREPTSGILYSLQIQTDGTNGGIIEIWDVDGEDGGADVSSGTTITNAQLLAAQSRGLAKLIYSQNFVASTGATPPGASFRGFMRGIAARFVAAAGSVNLNVTVAGGYRLVTKN